MTVLMLVCAFYVGRLGASITASGEAKREVGTVVYDKLTVAVDAGHGGIDSGKVGVNGALEKEISVPKTKASLPSAISA